MGGPENGNFPLLYVVKMSLRRWVGGSKKAQNTLKNQRWPLVKFHPKLVRPFNVFAGSKPPKFRGSPNVSLTKYQPSVFYVYFLLRK